MRISEGITVLVLGWLALTVPAVANEVTVPGDLVVRLAPGTPLAEILQDYQLEATGQLGARPIYLLRAAQDSAVGSTVTAMRDDGRVIYAEPNQVMVEAEGRKRAVWAIGEPDAYLAQWAPASIRLDEALTFASGNGVTVAVIDGGVDPDHPTLASRLVPGYDFVDADADPSEEGIPGNPEYGHGTHVSGLVALSAPGARIMPLRALDAQGRGTTWALAEALLWAVDPDGNPRTPDHAAVINFSVGTRSPTDLLRHVTRLVSCREEDDDDDDEDDEEDDEEDNDDGDDDERDHRADSAGSDFSADRERCSVQRGSVVLAAAGNSGSATELVYPAAEGAAGLLAVTASTPDDRLADFSNRGDWISIAAPGLGITSTVPDGRFGVWSGTSMASPIVAGLAALLVETNPTWTPEEVTERIVERSVALCGTSLRRIDAFGAVFDESPRPSTCE